jgi:hypothetical protein
MSPRTRAHALAIAGALGVFLLLLLALRLRSWLPFLGAALTYLGLLYAWRPITRPRPGRDRAMPEGVGPDDWRAALDALAAAGRELDRLAAEAPGPDAASVRRMAALVGAIRGHLDASPGHVPRTRSFVRHTLPRMVAAVAAYVDLARRAGPAGHPGRDPASEGRLAEVSRRLRGFVPALERIDRACVDDDLLALEITVEVLDEQLGRPDPGTPDPGRRGSGPRDPGPRDPGT